MSKVPVTLYSLPNCVQCMSTKRQFERLGIHFTEIDLSQNEEAMKHVQSLGYKEAPVIEVPWKHWSGFRLNKIQDLAHKLFREEQ